MARLIRRNHRKHRKVQLDQTKDNRFSEKYFLPLIIRLTLMETFIFLPLPAVPQVCLYDSFLAGMNVLLHKDKRYKTPVGFLTVIEHEVKRSRSFNTGHM